MPEPVIFTLLKGSPYTALDAALDSFLLSREAARLSPATLKYYENCLRPFVVWLRGQDVADPHDITANHLRSYLINLQRRGLADASQHAYARGIRSWLNWLVRDEQLDRSPFAKVDMPRVDKRLPNAYTPDDVRALLAACDRNTSLGLRNYAVILCLLDSGLRRQEFADLRPCDVNMKTGVVFVRHGKGGKQRQTRFGAKARAALLRYLATVEPEPDGLLFALTARGLQIMLYRLGKQVGIVPCSAHRFRRTFATYCLRDGMDLESLRLMLGHSDLSVLQRYLALGCEDIERVHVAHSPVDNWL